MRKQLILFIILMGILTGCGDATATTSVPLEAFVETNWERPIEGCVENLYFGEDKTFANYEGCGNEIDETYLYETYSYNEKTGIVELQAYGGSKTMSIKVVSCEEDKLVLDFAGEERTYEKAR